MHKLHFLIVDDDKLAAQMHASLLEKDGHKATIITTSTDVLKQIVKIKPDCILCDLMMPGLDGMDLFHEIRKLTNIKQPTFIILTGKVFDFDQRHSLEFGVNGYMTKPINTKTFVNDILEIMNGTIVIKFWGVRGTLPVPGKKSLKFGGNTNCVTMNIAKKHFFIFDAGTGIKELSNHLLKEKICPLKAKIFISHPHYDHINGLPFFVPLYMKGNEFEILGTHQRNISIEKLVANQMDSVYFPVTVKEFAAKINFHDLTEEKFNIDDVKVETMLLNHPGRCLGYRLEYKDKVVCYVTDHEFVLKDSPHYNQFGVDRMVSFVKDADVLIIDSTYSDEEYPKKIGWGHSCVSCVVEVADIANVKLLCLYHHDPDQTDKDIQAKLKFAIDLLNSRNSKTRCIAPHEGDEILV